MEKTTLIVCVKKFHLQQTDTDLLNFFRKKRGGDSTRLRKISNSFKKPLEVSGDDL
jgi:hypothetical protein